MPHFRMSVPEGAIDFDAIRAELHLPSEFPSAVLAEAEQAAAQRFSPEDGYLDATDIPLVTIDPAGSMDLDQAVHLAADHEGYLVHYAIADVAAFVKPGGHLDAQARSRGQTIYLPDGTVPLHPPVLSERAASLLPEQTRPAALWTIWLDSTGQVRSVDLTRAMVRSVARFDYGTVQADALADRLHPSIAHLPVVGQLRLARGVDRGAINLNLPEPQIVPHRAGWQLRVRTMTDIERYNAELSLLAGMCAAELMVGHQIGLLRTLPPAPEEALQAIERQARAAQIPWPHGSTLSQALTGVDPAQPRHLAFLEDAVRLLRGAGYLAFDGQVPKDCGHAGVGAPYAHVTAPLRRLGDRFATEICLALCAGQPVPAWVKADLDHIAEATESSYRKAGEVERACIDALQACLLRPLVGQQLTGIVVQTDRKRQRATVLVDQRQVRLTVSSADAQEGAAVTVRIDTVAQDTGQVHASLVTESAAPRAR